MSVMINVGGASSVNLFFYYLRGKKKVKEEREKKGEIGRKRKGQVSLSIIWRQGEGVVRRLNGPYFLLC